MHVAYMCVIVCVGCGVYVPASVCVGGVSFVGWERKTVDTKLSRAVTNTGLE